MTGPAAGESSADDVTDAGERVCADRADFGFFAHLSIYRFAHRHVVGRRVLDAGCGTGYGTHDLALAGAASVLGVDASDRAIAFCRDRYRHPCLAFEAGDLMALSVPGPFDVVFCSNVLEHLPDPDPFLEGVSRLLTPDGLLVMAVPPIRGLGEWFGNLENPYHVTNLPPEVWQAKLARFFSAVQGYSHGVEPALVDAGGQIRREAVTSAAPFRFAAETLERLSGPLPTISLINVATGPRSVPLPRTHAEDTLPIAWIEGRIRRDFGRLMTFKRRHGSAAA